MMKKIKKYETPEMEVIRFSTEDILTTSGGYDGFDTEDDLLEDLNG